MPSPCNGRFGPAHALLFSPPAIKRRKFGRPGPILAGELYASVSVGRRLLENLAGGQIKPNDSKVTSLSDRELQVFSLFGRGFGATRLAAELHLSVKTIETHQMRIKEKLGLHSAAELSKEASLWMSEVARRELAASR